MPSQQVGPLALPFFELGLGVRFIQVVEMPKDGLRKIREAEERAEDLVDYALENADRVASDAQTEASRLLSDAEAKAGREVSRLRAQVEAETKAEIAAIDQDTEKQRDMIRKQGTKHMEEAVRAIVEGIQTSTAGR